MQSDIAMQRIINRKYVGAPRQSLYTHDACEGEDSSTSNSLNTAMSRTTSTASLSLGIAGPLIFPSDHVLALIADGPSKASGEEVDSDEAEASCRTGNSKMIAPTNDDVSVSIEDRVNENLHIMALPPPPPILLKFVDVTYKVSVEKELLLLQSWMSKAWTKAMGKRKKVSEEDAVQQESSSSRRKKGKGKREKRIVKGVEGWVQAGEVLALMGPSGSGKTTLLNLLSGRLQLTPSTTTTSSMKPHHHLQGTITYNDMPYSKALKPRIGFVMQDDVLYPHLTVKETLMYAALLRLPKKLSKKERMERAMEVVYELGLERCQNTIIGGSFLRGVSGGERKRVCMGQEILINPSLLFLDEPTSGLDSTTALRILHTLQKISQVGRTVVTTIHQPSSRIFHMFDKLILLSGGHMLYFGKASIVMDYFSSIGFSPQIVMNPADFLLDLASGNMIDMSLPNTLLDQSNGIASTQFHTSGTIMSAIQASTRPLPKVVKQYLSRAYEEQKSAILEEPQGQKFGCQKNMAQKNALQWSEQEWNASWWSQFCVLYVRGLRERRHEYLSSLRILQVLASAIIIGCLWWHSNIQTERQLVDQVGLLFFIATYWGFFPLFTALFTFPLERAILAKERASNMYRLSAYFMARTLGDIPLDFCLPLLFHIIVYFMAHLRPTTTAFFLTLLTILLSTIASQGMGIAIGAIMMDLKKATTLASVVLLTFMLSGGFFVQSIPNFISWIRYISYNYHTFNLLVKIQYNEGQEVDCGFPIGCRKVVDFAIFHSMSLDGGGQEVVILLSMIVGYRLIAYVALRNMRLVV
ncbi:hypothetical protein GOP47_0004121 [Adiantum capillus-veneris]|uniref:ABC transporter domain-containing protein n=1 Tax=Adiantum capillus-veneris TaxID=13818 RepID=A0A9D4V799_ADICA|nr:hypothetical protein GOP47_0004121 [Adiantum capillus-veneris]